MGRLIALAPNQPRRFYRGGAAIAAWRGTAASSGHVPEDWVASTTTAFGEASLGLSRLPDGRVLRDAIADAPEQWLGAEHVAAFGADTCLLVKLLDAGQRLPVHVHPDVRFARRHLGLRHGKTEAWVVLDAAGADAAVFVGFATDVDAADLRRWVDEQDVDALLGSLHRLAVSAGDAVLVPAGTPHAIGAGIFCVELQEPTDLSILLESEGFDVDGDGYLGLGRDLALECVRRGAVPAAELERLWRPAGGGDLFDEQAAPFFRAQRIRPTRPQTLPASFAVLVTVAGSGVLAAESGDEIAVRRGDSVVVAHAAGAVTVRGRVEIVRCLPPRPRDVPAGHGV